MIDNYSLSFEVMKKQHSHDISTFTIIAWPRSRGPLHTFAVADDQTLRVFNPAGKSVVDMVHTWDPIM